MSRNPSQSLVSILGKLSIKSRMQYYVENNRQSTEHKSNYLTKYNCYVGNPMSEGNSKLDKSILIFDLLAIESCLNCEFCKATCYAMKSQRQYVNVLLKRTIHTYLAMNDLDTLGLLIAKQLRHTNRKIVRIHSSGDFINQNYVYLWVAIASTFKDIKFYTYTKVENILDLSSFIELPNTNVIYSVLPNGSLNYGDEDYIKQQSKIWNAPICAYRKGMPIDKIPHCGKSCFKCLNHSNVLFVQH